MARPKVPCTCPKCRKHSIEIDGVPQPGKYVTPETRRRHVEALASAKLQKSAGKPASLASVEQDSDWEDADPEGPSADSSAQTPAAETSTVIQLCCLLVIWLNTRAGISRDVANIVLKALQFIISAVLETVRVTLLAQGITADLPSFDLPRDIRTAYKIYGVEPEIVRTTCCPKCYTLYSGPLCDLPRRCPFKHSKKARACNADLWRKRRTRKGDRDVPNTMFNTQDFDSWLRFFLSQKGIEDHLEKTFSKTPPASDDWMHDVHDSPAWTKAEGLKDYLSNKYNLVFGLYIDWFNPYGNKISGKVVSCGAVVLYCLNLPSDVRYLPENVFIVGLIPSPSKPDAVLLTHMMDPIVKTVLSYEAGRQVPTYYHPDGVNTRARIIPLIADLLAAREAGGFLSHAAIQFCWYCLLTSDEKHRLDHLAWEYRSGAQVRREARLWRNETTLKGRNMQAKKTGVRWCSLHNLPYWNPVKHTLLGFMHNWLEGVLEHHLRTLWGIGRTLKKSKDLIEIQDEEVFDDRDEAESISELSSLGEPETEADIESLRMSLSSRPSVSNSSDSTARSSAASVSGPSAAGIPEDNNDSDWEDSDDDDMEIDSDFADIAVHGNFKFPKGVLEQIQTCIQEFSAPTWAPRPPGNLGEKKHGKLTANQYLVLFSAILPLVIPELMLDENDEVAAEMFKGFCHLVAATNIVSSFRTSKEAAEQFLEHYIAYRKHIQRTFPDCDEVPNHHYAMHLERILKFWGPLTAIAEFFGERLNGMLQKIKTNRHLYDMDYTMLRQMARRCRILAHQHNHEFQDPLLKEFSDILELNDAPKIKQPIELDDDAIDHYLSKAKKMSVKEYKLVMKYLNDSGEGFISWLSQPDIAHRSMILPPNAKHLRQFEEQDRTYSCHSSHAPNSLIRFAVPNSNDERKTGVIDTILEIPIHGFLRKFILVCPHRLLDSDTPHNDWPGLMTAVVDVEPYKTPIIIEPTHIITHLTAWQRPSQIYPGITKRCLVVCWALNRGRRGTEADVVH